MKWLLPLILLFDMGGIARAQHFKGKISFPPAPKRYVARINAAHNPVSKVQLLPKSNFHFSATGRGQSGPRGMATGRGQSGPRGMATGRGYGPQAGLVSSGAFLSTQPMLSGAPVAPIAYNPVIVKVNGIELERLVDYGESARMRLQSVARQCQAPVVLWQAGKIIATIN